MLKSCKRWLLAGILAIAPILSMPQAALAATNLPATSYFRSFDADYYLEKDADGNSSLHVVEEITAVFPSNSEEHGIERVLPFTGQEDLTDGKTLELVATRNGKPENIARIQTNKEDFAIRIGNPNQTVSGVQIYTLEYTYRNVITTEAAAQELYWNTNGTGWTKQFLNLTARVHFGDGLAKAYTGQNSCYVGRIGSNNQSRCTVTKIADGLEFKTSNLSAYENLTFAIAFDLGTFNDDAHAGYTLDTAVYTSQRLTIMTIIAGTLGVVIIILGLVAFQSTKQKRQFYKAYFVKPEYTPPSDFSVAEMAENYIGKAYGNRQVATLLGLAVNHKIELVKSETDGLFGKKVPAWTIRVKSNAMTKQQLIVLKILAGSNAAIHVGQEIPIKTHTATSTLTKLSRDFDESVKTRLEEEGLFESSKKAKTTTSTSTNSQKHGNLSNILIILAVLWVFVWLPTIAFAFDSDSLPNYVVLPQNELFAPLFAAILIGIEAYLVIMVSQTAKYEKRTEKGLEYSRQLDGLKLYMQMAEADRIKMLQSVKGADTTPEGIVKLYEKLLPYALIFQMEKSWLEELSRYYEQPDVATPAWYVGVGAFSARDFSSAMTQMSSTAASTIASSSSSSSSGGSGGGGFSGGGGGGGGGGTW